MSLRDWFAGQALPAVLVDDGMVKAVMEDAADGPPGPSLARLCYALADAMLKARDA